MKKRRPAATLLELMVVMCIIVVVSALALPSITAMYGPYKLNGGVDAVRAGWAEARARAIEEGRPYRFAVEPNGSAFRIAPDQDNYWDGSNGPENDPYGRGMIYVKALPAGVRFSVNGEVAANMPDEPTTGTLEEKVVTNTNWMPAAVFLPDGTAREDVKVTFQIRGCRPRSLQLRGLTGNVTEHQEP
jgi:Tfp pilus assembly protein FimT